MLDLLPVRRELEVRAVLDVVAGDAKRRFRLAARDGRQVLDMVLRRTMTSLALHVDGRLRRRVETALDAESDDVTADAFGIGGVAAFDQRGPRPCMRTLPPDIVRRRVAGLARCVARELPRDVSDLRHALQEILEADRVPIELQEILAHGIRTRGVVEDVAIEAIEPRPRPLGDVSALLTDIEDRHVLSDDPSFYVQNACVTDPTLAPRGQSTLYILAPVTHQHSNVNWQREGHRYRHLLLERIAQAGFKDVERRIRYERMLTPADWDQRYEIYRGATFNLAHSLDQMLHLRPHNRFEDLDGIYLVGGGTHPGSGLPVIFESARISAGLLLEDLGVRANGGGESDGVGAAGGAGGLNRGDLAHAGPSSRSGLSLTNLFRSVTNGVRTSLFS